MSGAILTLIQSSSRIIDIDVGPYVDFYKETDQYSFRHNDKLTLKIRYARTNVHKYTYFHRVFIREATSVNYVKALVKKVFYGLVHSLSVFIVILFNIYYYHILIFIIIFILEPLVICLNMGSYSFGFHPLVSVFVCHKFVNK